MVNITRVKLGDTLLGRKERGLEGRLSQPILTVVDINPEKGYITVKNSQGEFQMMEAKDLFTIHGSLAYMGRQIAELKRQLKEAQDLIIAIGTAAAVQSPEVAEELSGYLRHLVEPEEVNHFSSLEY